MLNSMSARRGARAPLLLALTLSITALQLSLQIAAQNATTGPRAAVSNDTVTSYFQVPPFALYLCPYTDSAATTTRAFGYNLPNASLPKSAAATTTGDSILAACPKAAASAGNYSGAGTTQTISLPIGSGSGSLRPETFYALLVQRKAGVQELTITLSVRLDGGNDSVLFDHEVLTLQPASGTTRRRSLLSTWGAVWGEAEAEEDELGCTGDAAVELLGGGRALLKGSSGGGGKSSGGGGGKSSGGSKSSGGGKSKSGSSGGKPAKGVKTSSLVKGGTYASRTGAAALYWGTVKTKNRYRIKSSKHHYSLPTKALAYGLPLFFAAWFLTPPLAAAYGYTGMSLFQQADPFAYAVPATWPSWQSAAGAATASNICPDVPLSSAGSGQDCWQAGSSTCCGLPYTNAKFGTQSIPANYSKLGTVLKCGLRNDLVLALPIYLPNDASTVQLVVHSIEAKLGTSSCGTTNQTLDPTNPAAYLSLVKMETVDSAASHYRASVPLIAAATVLVAWLFVLS